MQQFVTDQSSASFRIAVEESGAGKWSYQTSERGILFQFSQLVTSFVSYKIIGLGLHSTFKRTLIHLL